MSPVYPIPNITMSPVYPYIQYKYVLMSPVYICTYNVRGAHLCKSSCFREGRVISEIGTDKR